MKRQKYLVNNRLSIAKESWDAFVDASDEAWLWHRYYLQDALVTWGKQDLSFAVCETGSGDILALVPLQLLEGKVARVIPWNMLDSLGGPALKNGLGRKQRAKILAFVEEKLFNLAQQHNVVETNLALSPMTPAFRGDHCPRVNPLLALGCENTLTQTWVVDLRLGQDAVWQSMEGRARTAVRKAKKMGVSVRLANQPGDLDIYYRLHCETYERTGVRPHPRAYFEAIWTNFLSTGLAHILFAEYEGQTVAAENFGVYKQAGLYWTGAASQQGLSINANSLLQWEAMKWMVEHGISWYETGEAFPYIKGGKLKGLNDFKKSFGGTLYPFYRGRILTRKRAHSIVSFYREIRCR